METESASPVEGRPRLTKGVLFVVCTVCLVDNINSTILVPYVDALVSRLLHVKRGDPSVAPWVSVLTGSYSLCEVLFSALWGMLSDRIGRRPVLLIGLAGSAVAPVLFGLSQSLSGALLARLLDGFFCGNVGVTRTYLGELVDPSNETEAFGMLAFSFSVGIFIGPLLGGMLSEPTSWAPETFRGTIFDKFPYLLPNLSYACVAVVALCIGFASLKETRTPRRIRGRVGPHEEPLASGDTGQQTGRVFTRPLLRLLSVYTILSGYAAGRTQAFVLVLSLPRSLNGFAYRPREFGLFQVVASIAIFLTQMFLYQRGIKRYGPSKGFRMGMWLTVLLCLPFPAFGLLADPQRFPVWRWVPIVFFQFFSAVGFTFCFPTMFMLINRECGDHNRGVINGWSNSTGALSRGLFPLLTGAIFSLGNNLEAVGLAGGRYLVFYVMAAAGALAAWLIARYSPASLPEPVPAQTQEQERSKSTSTSSPALDACMSSGAPKEVAQANSRDAGIGG